MTADVILYTTVTAAVLEERRVSAVQRSRPKIACVCKLLCVHQSKYKICE